MWFYVGFQIYLICSITEVPTKPLEIHNNDQHKNYK